jgi:hypothetical protein
MGRIYHERYLNDLRWRDIYTLNFIKIGTGVQAILQYCLSNLKAVMLVLLMRGFMMYAVEMDSGKLGSNLVLYSS